MTFTIKKMTLLGLVLLIFQGLSIAQCKFKIHKKFLAFPKNQFVPKATQATKAGALFSKMDFTASYSFVQSGEDTFWYLGMARKWSKKFELNKSCGITFFAEDGTSIQLFPNGFYKGRFILTMYNIGAYFPITKEQLTFLSKHEIKDLLLTFSYEGDIDGGLNWDGGSWGKDKNGNITFRTKVKSGNFRRKMREHAGCMLSILK